ncbi:MAG: glycosyltransferase family 4 protein [Gaiella sp.]
MKRRLLMASRTRYSLPLSPSLERKFAALAERFDVTVLAAAARGSNGSDSRFRLFRPLPVERLDGPLFYLLFPFRVARELRRLRPEVVLVQGAQETALALAGRALVRSRAGIILDLHGDPGAPTRLYGSTARSRLAPLADLLARLAIRRADGVRTLSPFTSGVVRRHGVEPAGEFPAFMDLGTFTSRPVLPLPETPSLLFVGVLQRYKAFDVIADAWRLAAPRVPAASLHVVGRGPLQALVEELQHEFPGRVTHTPSLTADGVAAAFDEATALVLASRSEGLPRIVVESFCRGRAVVGACAGGIPDIVSDDENGVLVLPEDAGALAEAIAGLLGDRERAARLGAGAERSAAGWLATPDDSAERTRELVERVLARRAAP